MAERHFDGLDQLVDEEEIDFYVHYQGSALLLEHRLAEAGDFIDAIIWHVHRELDIAWCGYDEQSNPDGEEFDEDTTYWLCLTCAEHFVGIRPTIPDSDVNN